MFSVYRDTNAGLNLTAQFGSTLCISYSNVEKLSFQSPLQMLQRRRSSMMNKGDFGKLSGSVKELARSSYMYYLAQVYVIICPLPWTTVS